MPLIGGYPATFIKSIQRGSVALINTVASNTATITSVDTANSIIRWLGHTLDTGGTDAFFSRAELTNATTVTAVRNTGANIMSVSYEVIEFYPGVLKSVQRGTIALATVASNTATISSVDTTKTMTDYLGGITNDAASGDGKNWPGKVVLTNATTVTASHGSALNTLTIGYQAAEFY